MDATLRISLSELTPGLIANLKSIFSEKQEVKLTIEPVSDFGLNRRETKEEYFMRINEVLKNLEQGRSVAYSEEEFDQFVENLGK